MNQSNSKQQQWKRKTSENRLSRIRIHKYFITRTRSPATREFASHKEKKWKKTTAHTVYRRVSSIRLPVSPLDRTVNELLAHITYVLFSNSLFIVVYDVEYISDKLSPLSLSAVDVVILVDTKSAFKFCFRHFRNNRTTKQKAISNCSRTVQTVSRIRSTIRQIDRFTLSMSNGRRRWDSRYSRADFPQYSSWTNCK